MGSIRRKRTRRDFATLRARPARRRACSTPIAPTICTRCARLQADAVALTARGHVLLVAVPMFHANGWGTAVRGPRGWRQAGPAWPAHRRREPRPPDSRRESHRRGRHPDALARGGRSSGLAAARLFRTCERIIIGGSSCPESADRSDGAAAWRAGPDQLGHDRAFAARNHHRRSPLKRPPVGAGSAADGARPQADRRGGCNAARAARRARPSASVKGASVVDRYFGDGGRRARRRGLFRHRRSRDDRRCGQYDHLRPVEGPDQVGRRVDQSGRDRGDRRQCIPASATSPSSACRIAKWGERPLLVVEPQPGRELDVPRMLACLARAVVPTGGFPTMVAQSPPCRSPATGKIDKNRLRADFAAGKIATEPLSRLGLADAQFAAGGNGGDARPDVPVPADLARRAAPAHRPPR